MYSAIWSYKCKTPYPLLPPPERLLEYKEHVKQKLRQKGIFNIEIEHSIQQGSVKVYFTPKQLGVQAVDWVVLIGAIASLLTASAYLIASLRDKNPEFIANTYDHRFSDNVPDWLKDFYEKQTGEKFPRQLNFEEFISKYWWIILLILLIFLIKR